MHTVISIDPTVHSTNKLPLDDRFGVNIQVSFVATRTPTHYSTRAAVAGVVGQLASHSRFDRGPHCNAVPRRRRAWARRLSCCVVLFVCLPLQRMSTIAITGSMMPYYSFRLFVYSCSIIDMPISYYLSFFGTYDSDCHRVSFGIGRPLDRCSWTILIISPLPLSPSPRTHVMTPRSSLDMPLNSKE